MESYDNGNTEFYTLLVNESDKMSALLSRISNPSVETVSEAAYLLSQCADSIRNIMAQQTYFEMMEKGNHNGT